MTGSPQTLRPATAEEIAYIRTLNAASWAGDLDVKTYHDRERVLASTPLTRNGGISSWVLVDPAADPHDILSSCETIKKRAFVSLPPPHPADVGPAGGDGPGDGDDTTCLVSLVMAHGVGNVFTPPQHRGNGYAKTMLRLLAEALKRGSPESFSVLYSDIGKVGSGSISYGEAAESFPPPPVLFSFLSFSLYIFAFLYRDFYSFLSPFV